MRLLHLSDTHLGADLPAHGHTRGWRRAQDHARAFHAALGPALREEVDAVVHSGDLFDRSAPPPEAVAFARRLLAEVGLRMPVAVLSGNHDRRGLARLFGPAPPGVEVVDTPQRLVVAGLSLGFVPHRREAEAWVGDAARLAEQGVDALVAHQSFHGARVPDLTFRAGVHAETVGAQGIPRQVRTILCGHIHPRQVLHLGGTAIVYPGSTERTSFREGPAPKGYALWDFGREVRWRLVELPSRPRVVVASAADLALVVPGALVRLAPVAADGLAEQVGRRGGWLVGARPAPKSVPQLELF